MTSVVSSARQPLLEGKNMSIAMKLWLSATIVLVGSIVAAIVRDLVGVGQYIASGVIVLILFYIWSRPRTPGSDTKGKPHE